MTPSADGVYQVVLTFGYMDEHDVLERAAHVRLDGARSTLDEATFFLGRETVASIPEGEMPRWREQLFVVLHRGRGERLPLLPPAVAQVFEVGTQVEI